jgi:hypothetical protein
MDQVMVVNLVVEVQGLMIEYVIIHRRSPSDRAAGT